MSNCESILKYTRYALLIAGAFDIQNGTKNSSFLYKIWSFFSLGYYFLFVMSFLVGMIDLLMDDVDVVTFNVNMQTFLSSFLLLMKIVLFCTRGIRDIMKEVYQFEYDITHDDLECTRMYNRNSRYNYKIFFLYAFLMSCTGCSFMVATFNGWKLMNVENSTENKTLIYHAWFPFDIGNPTYFNVAYFFQFLVGIWLPLFVVMIDSLFISMVVFATARVEILGYKFEHFEMYSNGRNESTFHGLRNIVIEHQNLIRSVEDIKKSLKWYLFAELLVKSYHITVSLLNVIHATNKGDIVFYLSCVMVLLLQVMMVYYNANELSLQHAMTLCCCTMHKYTKNEARDAGLKMFQSTNLSLRIFKSNWYDQCPEIVRSLSIVMARVQRPLVLIIGDFRVIDNELIVNMIKAAYTFLLYQEI